MTDHDVEINKSATSPKTLASYLIGLGLSLIFTFIAFWLVSAHPMTTEGLYITLTALALAQFLAQVIFFLRLNMNPEGRLTSISFIFVLFVVLILVVGSLWIMYNLNYNMVN